jgi:nucleotide-binding universal stress UspA family protein
VITFLHVISVPTQVPLRTGRDHIEESKPLTRKAIALANEYDLDAEVILRISHRPSDAIIHTALERDIDLLIMGWQGQSEVSNTSIGRNVDQIIEAVNCEVLVVQQVQEPPFHHIMAPIINPLQTESAVDHARLLMNGAADIDVVHVFNEGASEQEREQFTGALQLQLDALANKYEELDGHLQLKTMTNDDVVAALADIADAYDCVILGTTRDTWLKQRFFGSKPSQIAQNVQPPVILVRPAGTQLGFGTRRFLNYVRGGYRRIDPTSERELREQGILVEEAEATSPEEQHTSVNKPALLLSGVLAVAAVTMMYLGSGGQWTWVGTIAFFVAMIWFTIVEMKGTEQLAG